MEIDLLYLRIAGGGINRCNGLKQKKSENIDFHGKWSIILKEQFRKKYNTIFMSRCLRSAVFCSYGLISRLHATIFREKNKISWFYISLYSCVGPGTAELGKTLQIQEKTEQ